MKNSLLLLASMVLLFASCGTKKPIEPAATTTDVVVKMQHTTQGKSLEQNVIKYTNAAGNEYSIGTLRYYLSNAKLVKNDGTEVAINVYKLIDAFDASRLQFTLKSIPNGTYTSLKFLVGIDQTSNHTGAQEGDLDPIYGMIWTWATGYIFLKHEGQMKDPGGNTVGFSYHIANDKSATMVTMPLNIVANGTTKTVTMNFDVNNLYQTPSYDFNVDRYVHSDEQTQTDIDWLAGVTSNIQECFTLVSVQ